MAMPIGDSSRMASLLQQQALLPRDATAETPPPTEDNDAFERGEQAPQGLMDRGRIQAQQARQSARGQRLDGGDDAARRMTDHHPQQASAEELRAIRRELKDAHKALRGDGVPDMRQRNEMTRIRGQLGDVNAGLARINDADRERKWEKVTDLVGHEPSGTYKAYFKASNVPMKEMAEVVRVADDLADPESARRTHGNDVKVLARDRMWAEKINLLDGAVREPVRGGKPVEIDVEYYELSSPQILNRLKQAANGGANVRVLVDSGRLDQGPGGSRNASSLAGRLNTLAQLQEGDAEKKPAVTLFANEKVLGSKQELMHRKLLRVGDDVVFGGMNANEGSGESVDFAMRIRGPAAGELVGTFREDVNASRGASDEEIFGKQLDDVRGRENITLDRRGVADFISALSADVPGTSEGSANERSAKQLEALEKKGVDVGTLVELPAGRDMRDYLDSSRDGHGGHLKMTEAGRHLLADQLEARVARTRKAENLEALSDISDPSTAKKASGGDTIAVADESVERQAAVLHAIDSAEKFVKVSAFVVTDDVAKSLIEKRDQMVAQGKPFDAQVMLDPGLYGHGGTPNTTAYKLLEDSGIDVRWNLLERSDPGHDRKNHSKMIVTDKVLVAGSTNFSAKGLRNNWEASEITWFGDDDASRAKQKDIVADFDRTWERETISVNTRALTDARFANSSGEHLAARKDGYRNALMNELLVRITEYEKQSGVEIQSRLADPEIAARVAAQRQEGVAHGYALLNAVGPDELARIREKQPAYQELLRLQSQGLR